MKVKIDTKEMFHVICIEEEVLSANMAAELIEIIEKKQDEDTKSIVLDCSKLADIEKPAVEYILRLHEHQIKRNKSFVICEMKPSLKGIFQQESEVEGLQFTPTASEAWDIVQMEEIERELGFDE